MKLFIKKIGLKSKDESDLNNTYFNNVLFIPLHDKDNDFLLFLLQHGTDPNIYHPISCAPVYYARNDMNIEAYEMLLDHGDEFAF